ncbi:MAG TPA: hypothetical protein VH370_16670 [Humisphaera sp.]|jgi:hypothetical protein|nr:hypothetical protein [Humisphaera sp.]
MESHRPQKTPHNKPPRRKKRPATGEDFNLFNAIVGSQPIAERTAAERAAVESINELREQEELARAAAASRSQFRGKSFDAPLVLSHFRHICGRGLAMGVNSVKRPEVANWLRTFSGRALRRLEEAQTRLNLARRRVRQYDAGDSPDLYDKVA